MLYNEVGDISTVRIAVVVLLLLTGTPWPAPATYLENSINPACVTRVFRDPRFNVFEPAARVLAYLDCTTQALGELRTWGRQLLGTLEQMTQELNNRVLPDGCDIDQREAFLRYRGEAIAAAEEIQRRGETIMTVLRLVRVQREEDLRVEAARGVLRGTHVDWAAQVRARNQQEQQGDWDVYSAVTRAQEFQGRARKFIPGECPLNRCRWVSEQSLGLMGSRGRVCMCGNRFMDPLSCLNLPR